MSERVSSTSDNCVLQCRLAGKKAHSWPSESSSSLATSCTALRQSFFRGRSLFTVLADEKDGRRRISRSSILFVSPASPTTFDPATPSRSSVVFPFLRVSASATAFLSSAMVSLSESVRPSSRPAKAFQAAKFPRPQWLVQPGLLSAIIPRWEKRRREMDS